MYINPFLCGVLATIGVEITAILVAALVSAIRRVKRGNIR